MLRRTLYKGLCLRNVQQTAALAKPTTTIFTCACAMNAGDENCSFPQLLTSPWSTFVFDRIGGVALSANCPPKYHQHKQYAQKIPCAHSTVARMFAN